MKYFILAFKNWNKFNGRANQSEFWYYNLFYFVIIIILNFADYLFYGYDPMDATSIAATSSMFQILCIIPSLSVTIRRLHDVNKSGWNMLWSLTIVGIFYVLYLEIKKGNDGPNNYGDVNPYGGGLPLGSINQGTINQGTYATISEIMTPNVPMPGSGSNVVGGMGDYAEVSFG